MKCYILIILLFVSFTQSAKILSVFPFPVKSHHILGSTLLKELANRGHDVTMISSFPLKNPPKNYHDVYLEGLIENKEKLMTKFYNPNVTMFEMYGAMLSSFTEMSTLTLDNKNFKEFMKTKPKFDLVIHLWALNEAMLGIGHAVNATTIAFSMIGTSSVINYATKQPSPYSYVPNPFLGLTDEMTFFERVLNTLISIIGDFLINFVHLSIQQRNLQDYFPDAPPLQELIDNVDLFLFNTHYSTESPRPYLPNMIQIGGFHLQQKQKLPDDVKRFLDGSKRGVVYFSFGSNLRSENLPENLVAELVEGLGKLDYDVLWKFDYEIKSLPKNFKAVSWIPQLAVLEHPNIKVFVTHGGLGSTVESIYNGVPMIAIPLFGDQGKNSADIAGRKLGVKLNKETLTADYLVGAIKEVTENPVYLKNVLLQSDIYKNQEVNPMDKAVYWVEHVLKHKGAKHLKSMASQLPWYQYCLLDVFLFLGTTLGIILFVSIYVIKKLLGCCCKSKAISKQSPGVKKVKSKKMKRM